MFHFSNNAFEFACFMGQGQRHRGRSSGPVPAGRLCWAGWRAWRAGSAGMAGRVELGGQAGAGRVVGGGAGRVGQDRAGPGRSSCERTHEWFLEMCVPSELARGIKLATNLDT